MSFMNSISKLTKRIFGDANERELKRIQPIVEAVNALESKYEALDDDELKAMTPFFKEKIEQGVSLDDLLPEAFAVVREAAKRTLGQRHYDCQIIGGVVLHQGRISEMKTGEGKTLVATLPVYLNALVEKGVHVVTVNDYLAERDAEWMGEVYNFLGLSVGTILSGERNDAVKREAYAADITYGTNNEFGFDYLRDNMKYRLEDFTQRGHFFGIVDEVDSILIDEARTPLIISGPAASSVELYSIVDGVIPFLQDEIDFNIDEKSKNVMLTDEGVSNVEAKLGIDNLFDVHNMEVLHHVNQSLKAYHVFRRDRDYMVREGKVIIVDEFTGRLMHGRRWSDGLHQAVEAKEKVTVQAESQTYATVTFQNLFRMYDKLAGMTGTAATEAAEFASIYDLDTVVIPTNRPIARDDAEDIVYKTQMEKFRAVIEDIKVSNGHGQPILVGTTSVEKSEIVSKLLERAKIPHEVLNAKNHGREAQIIAQAGRLGSVTISTNMAGRGTDIKLGGNPEALAGEECDPEQDPEGYEKVLETLLTQCGAECLAVKEAGGLHIIGTERHESRRVDNQLRGRSGRQGDRGSSRFFLSLEDDLLRIFGSDKITVWMERMGLKDDEPIEHRWITSSIENAQKKVEGHHFQVRKNLLEYDDVMNYQRKGVYDYRSRALGGENIEGMITEAVDNVVLDIMDECAMDGANPEHWNIDGIKARLERVFGIIWEDTPESLRDMARKEIHDRILEEARALIAARREEMEPETFRQIGRMLLLQFTDQLWKDHLLGVDRLRQGVSLRGYGQQNPLLEYKREAFHMFLEMSAVRDESVLNKICMAQEGFEEAAAAPSKRTARKIAKGALEPNPEVKKPQTVTAPPLQPAPPPVAAAPTAGEETRAYAKANGVRRNDPCPCGSAMKFKRCCGRGPNSVEASGAPA